MIVVVIGFDRFLMVESLVVVVLLIEMGVVVEMGVGWEVRFFLDVV